MRLCIKGEGLFLSGFLSRKQYWRSSWNVCIPCLRDDNVVEWRMAVPEPGETKFDHHDGLERRSDLE